MPLAKLRADYIHAAFSGLYLETLEPDEGVRELQLLFGSPQKTAFHRLDNSC